MAPRTASVPVAAGRVIVAAADAWLTMVVAPVPTEIGEMTMLPLVAPLAVKMPEPVARVKFLFAATVTCPDRVFAPVDVVNAPLEPDRMNVGFDAPLDTLPRRSTVPVNTCAPVTVWASPSVARVAVAFGRVIVVAASASPLVSVVAKLPVASATARIRAPLLPVSEYIVIAVAIPAEAEPIVMPLVVASVTAPFRVMAPVPVVSVAVLDMVRFLAAAMTTWPDSVLVPVEVVKAPVEPLMSNEPVPLPAMLAPVPMVWAPVKVFAPRMAKVPVTAGTVMVRSAASVGMDRVAVNPPVVLAEVMAISVSTAAPWLIVKALEVVPLTVVAMVPPPAASAWSCVALVKSPMTGVVSVLTPVIVWVVSVVTITSLAPMLSGKYTDRFAASVPGVTDRM